MSAQSYQELVIHVGHRISVVKYGNQNTAIECETCNEVLIDYDREEEDMDKE